jgi:hypothetical protein
LVVQSAVAAAVALAHVDWEGQDLFSLDERGQGECAV